MCIRYSIYVSHDQTEALTFADQVVVMDVGEVVQIGTPIELFENPKHTFVGHFIGSPGMNVLPCQLENGFAVFGGQRLTSVNQVATSSGKTEIGIRPEFVSFAKKRTKSGIDAKIIKVSDAGRFNIVQAECDGHRVNLLVKKGEDIPTENARLVFDPAHTRIYVDGWLGGEGEM
jgi:glycerol transport system ATP-binding protein